MSNKLHALSLGYAGAILSALGMLLLSVGANLGLYTGAAEQMMRWHLFYRPSIGGTVSGMIEAAVISFVFFYVFGLLYNRLAK